jgi:hypothetical protein
MSARSDLLSSRCLIKVGKPVAGPLRCGLWRATVGLNRLTNRPQLQFSPTCIPQRSTNAFGNVI